ncbi:MAG: hypothetical protein WCO94_14290 [Verrucomicrobiota bacterium]
MSKAVLGRWRIVEMSTWDSDYIDMVSPGMVAFKKTVRGSSALVVWMLNWTGESRVDRKESNSHFLGSTREAK